MRKSWDHYFMDMAYMAATRATCPRRHVGAILVKDKKLLGSAYNGAPAGVEDCEEAGCLMSETIEEVDGIMIRKEHCVRTIHAEQNLILFTDRDERVNATIYVTDQPCWICTKMLANSGISEIIYHRPYQKDFDAVDRLLRQKGMIFRNLEDYQLPLGMVSEVIE